MVCNVKEYFMFSQSMKRRSSIKGAEFTVVCWILAFFKDGSGTHFKKYSQTGTEEEEEDGDWGKAIDYKEKLSLRNRKL